MNHSSLIENILSNRVTWLKVSLLAILVLSFTSCSFKKDDAQNEDPQVVIKEQVETGAVKGANLALQIVPLQKIHEYAVKVDWAIPENCLPKIQKREERAAFFDILPIASGETSLIDDDVQESKKYVYTLICNVNGAERAVETLSLTVPTDLTLSGALTLNELDHKADIPGTVIGTAPAGFVIRAARILLSKNVSIKTEGMALRIDAKEIVAEPGSLLYTFSASADMATGLPIDMASGSNGKSGGQIVLSSKSGTGSLEIHMIGQAGGIGPKGPVRELKKDEKLPADGNNGSSAEYEFRKGACRTVGNHRTESREICESPKFICTRQPTNGLDGERGLKGNPGGRGYNGGASGVAHILVESGDLRVSITRSGGAKGPKGPGGDGMSIGGAPGKAGSASLQDWRVARIATGIEVPPLESTRDNTYCNPAKGGKWGDKGPDGDLGDEGLEGSKETSYIYNPTTKQMDQVN